MHTERAQTDHTKPMDSRRPRSRPAWPTRLIDLARMLGACEGTREREPLRAEVWLLLNTVLQQRIRYESWRMGPIGPEDLEDLAAEKSLDLMEKLDAGRWDLAGSGPENAVAFVATVARNGLVDCLRRRSRSPIGSTVVEGRELSEAIASNRQTERSDAAAERAGFVAALVECAGVLKPSHRKIWLLRAFLDLSSKAVAAHPEVGLKPAHVDVIMQRCRSRLRDCMGSKGYAPNDVPPGTFVALWRAFRLEDHLLKDASDGSP